MRAVFRDAPLVVWGTTLLHAVIASMLLIDPAAAQSTAPAEVVQYLGRVPAATAMFAASALAVFVMLRAPGEWSLVLLMPQQILLYVAAWGGLQAVVDGQYADGVLRPYAFILTDQLPVMLLALLHTLAILEMPWSDRT
jgi:hypothetical protein